MTEAVGAKGNALLNIGTTLRRTRPDNTPLKSPDCRKLVHADEAL
jgi:hypothetical protein